MVVFHASMHEELAPFVPTEREDLSKRFPIFPLSTVHAGETVLIHSISGKDATRSYLHDLGFIVNVPLSVVTEAGGHVIVKIKETKVAISKALARRIMVNRSGGSMK